MTLAALLQCRHLSHRVADAGEASLRSAAPRLQALSHGLRFTAPPLSRLAARLGNRAQHGPHVEADAASIASSEADAETQREQLHRQQQRQQSGPFFAPHGADSFADAAPVGIDHDGPDHDGYDDESHGAASLPHDSSSGSSEFKPPLPPRNVATATLDTSRGLFSAVSTSSASSSAASFVHQSRPGQPADDASQSAIPTPPPPPPPGVNVADAAAVAVDDGAFDFDWWGAVEAQPAASSIFDLNVIIHGGGVPAGQPGAADNIVVPPVAGGPVEHGGAAPAPRLEAPVRAAPPPPGRGRGFGVNINPNQVQGAHGASSTLRALATGSLQDLRQLMAMPPEHGPRTSLSFI
jgi:hypothetical protein